MNFHRCRAAEGGETGAVPPLMPARSWFPTFIYREPLQSAGLVRFNAELADECRRLRDFDAAGRRWSAKNYPGGYTSYASMN